jgi:dTDP-4-amino-4,6-dideoxygalactose transaminase
MISFLDLKSLNLRHVAEYSVVLQRVLQSGSFIQGEELTEFERAFSQYCGVEHAIGVSNGLDALFLILKAYGIGPGDEVIVPANTFIATWLAVSRSGATIVAVEPDDCTFNLCAARVAAAITPQTRAIIVVHLHGICTSMEGLQSLAKEHDLRLIEDAAQAHGARYREQTAGALGDAAAFSFYPSKNLGALGDAGAVTTRDTELAGRVRKLSNYGSGEKYIHDCLGYNCRLDEVQAGFLQIRLEHLDADNKNRRRIATAYLEGLQNCGLTLPFVPNGCEPVWHLFVVRTPDRDGLRRFLASQGVASLIHYPIPPHLQGAYENMGLRKGTFPISERMHQQVLSLPLCPTMTDDDVAHVIHCIRSWWERHRDFLERISVKDPA